MYSPISLKVKNMISFEGEHEYQFRKGEAIVVTGINHDDPSQAVNGTGKSSLIESIAVAFTGTSIRDVKAKELINRRSKDGEVDLILTNPKLNHNLRIWRKIYAGSKSAECRIWINDDEVRLSDINSYNKFVFDQIGLTKEDFFNFFLLVQANYQPFLRVGDTKKKEIINRFSGADNVDELIPLVKRDLDLFDPEFEEVNGKLTANTAKIELIDGQLDALKDQQSTWDEDKKQLIEALQVKIDEWDEEKLKRWDLAFAHLDAAKVNKRSTPDGNWDKRIELLETKKLEVAKRAEEVKEVIAQLKKDVESVKLRPEFKKRSTDIDKIKTQLEESITENKEILKEYEKYQADLNKQLLGSIECPSCHHEFSLANKDFDPTEAKSQLGEIQEEIDVAKKTADEHDKSLEANKEDKKKLQDDIDTAQQSLKQDISKLDDKIVKLRKVYNNCVAAVKRLFQEKRDYERKISNAVEEALSSRIKAHQAQSRINGLLAEIDVHNRKDFSAEIRAKMQERKSFETAYKEAKTEFDELTVTRQAVAEWETNFKNFKSYIANQSIKNIEDYTNLFLQQMGSDLGIKLDGYTTLASKKIKEQISTNVLRGGFDEGSYGAFSGGERGRIDICVIIAIQQLINLNCPSGGLDLLICDEILDQIDALGLESIINSLQNLDRTIMIVSQNEINTLKKYTLLIEKRNKISKFVV